MTLLGADRARQWRCVAPGLGVAAGVALGAYLLGLVVPVSALVLAVAMGTLVMNLAGSRRPVLAPGAQLASRTVLRIGIALLGFRLAVDDAIRLGAAHLAVVVVVVATTFVGTRALGRRLGLGSGISTLTATGFAICGASAIAAMEGVVDAEEEEVAYAIGLVTLCGTLAILVLPPVAALLDLDAEAFGAWAGASVRDVGQVIATASTQGSTALTAAMVVKLTRVALLAPLVAVTALARRRAHRDLPHSRPPLVPWFIVAFVAAIVLRSTGIVPDAVLTAIRSAEIACFAIALAGLGMAVDLDRLRRLGHRPIVLGLLSWALIAGVSYAGVWMLG